MKRYYSGRRGRSTRGHNMRSFTTSRSLSAARRGVAIVLLAATVATLATPSATLAARDDAAVTSLATPNAGAVLPSDGTGDNPIMP